MDAHAINHDRTTLEPCTHTVAMYIMFKRATQLYHAQATDSIDAGTRYEAHIYSVCAWWLLRSQIILKMGGDASLF